MKKDNDRELKAKVAAHAKYIEQWILDDRFYSKPSIDSLDAHPDRNRSHHDFAGLMLELGAAEKELDDARKRLQRLRRHFSNGVMLPFENVAGAVNAAGGLAAQACAAVGQAIEATKVAHPDHTAKMMPQRLAVGLAWAEIGDKKPRDVRKLAKKIIEAVKPPLKTPSEKTLSNMIEEAKLGKFQVVEKANGK